MRHRRSKPFFSASPSAQSLKLLEVTNTKERKCLCCKLGIEQDDLNGGWWCNEIPAAQQCHPATPAAPRSSVSTRSTTAPRRENTCKTSRTSQSAIRSRAAVSSSTHHHFPPLRRDAVFSHLDCAEDFIQDYRNRHSTGVSGEVQLGFVPDSNAFSSR